jgi:hypothetical protein
MPNMTQAKDAYEAGRDHWADFVAGKEPAVIPEKYDTEELRDWYAKGAATEGRARGVLVQQEGTTEPQKPKQGELDMTTKAKTKTRTTRRSGRQTFKTPDGCWNRVHAAAEKNGRSMTAEIRARLERSFMLDEMRQIIREELDIALDK